MSPCLFCVDTGCGLSRTACRSFHRRLPGCVCGDDGDGGAYDCDRGSLGVCGTL